jgi:hypothetical protein
MVDLMTAIATATQAINLAKQIREADNAFGNAEWKFKTADLNSALADLKNALIDAKEEIRAKDDEIKRLSTLMHKWSETVEVKGFHYDKDSDGNPRGAPYCPVCFQKDGFMFHLTNLPGTGSLKKHCPHCKAVYGISSLFPD